MGLKNIIRLYKTPLICLTLIGFAIAISTTRNVNAGFKEAEVRTHVSIDGVSYGNFDSILGIESAFLPSKERISKISMKRQFVTDKSLSYWAQKAIEYRQSDKKNIVVTYKNQHGETLRTLELSNTVPLGWTVESSNTEQGGFYEKIDLAVEEIRIR